MANLKEELWNTLEELTEGDFKNFKWFLKQDGILKDFKGIPEARLEKAERQDTVDLMVQQYQEHGALKVTLKVLKKINRNDLVQRLQQSISQPKDLKTRDFSFAEELLAFLNDLEDDSDSDDDDSDSDDDDSDDDDSDDDALLISQIKHPLNLKTHDFSDQKEYERKKAELKSVQQFAVEVTLDPDTAHPDLILSEDGKQVHDGDVRQKLPDNPERFYRCVNVFGKQSFSSGRFYYEVQVKGKRAWTLGVAKQSIDRKGSITLNPRYGFWTFGLRNKNEYKALAGPSVLLSLKSQPEKVGVFVDYDEGLVRFYDVDTADVLYSFTGCSFTEKLLPYFSPCTNDDGTNSAPLIISPLNHPLNIKTHDFSDQREYERKKAELKSVQQFAVEVTLDPDTAHPKLILSEDGKQVHHGDVRKKLPNNPERFDTCVNVLGKQSVSSGRFYYEVQVKGKTEWDLGVVKESIDRKGNIRLAPEDGFWTIWLREGYKYKAIDDPSVRLSIKSHPEKVGVFVDYDEGLVRFYDVSTADVLYSFTGCSFTEKLLPFFSPCTNDGGTNSAPLIISPLNHPLNVKTHDFSDQREYERKKAELKSVQQFAVEVTLDPDTAHPKLILSEDGKQVHNGVVRKNLLDNPERFDRCVSVLGKESFSSGRFYYEVQVKGKTEWTLGVAKESIDRKGSITLSPEDGFWAIWLREGYKYKAIDDPSVRLSLKSHPEKVGVFVDYDEGLVRFYDVDTADVLYSFTGCSFTEKLLPYFSPCTNDGGTNSAPLIISPVNHPLNVKTHDFSDQREYEIKKAELKSVQQFAVEVTLDPDTAHPALLLSEDGKQVHCGDVYKKFRNNRKRFDRCVNVLGNQSFSSGRFYYEVQVKGKTAWTLGVVKESIDRKGNIRLAPEDGFWTIWLREGCKYEAIDDPSVHLSIKSQPEKVGVFVDYDEGLLRFYDVSTADLLYSFTDCSFTEKLLPYLSPCTNKDGTNSAPLIISPLNHLLYVNTHDFSDQREYERKKAELKSVQQFAVEVTLDPDTAHPALLLSEDGKQVHDGDVRKKLPNNPERFDTCVNVLGKQSISSGRFYYEVQVKGKTEWTLGVVKESIDRKGNIRLSPRNGFWTIWLREGCKYKAIDDPSVHLSIKSQPEKVGVFVDYDEGLVRFYDVDTADLLYSFTGCSFTEKLLPYLSPCTNDDGTNSAPLIISPVNHLLNVKTHDFSDQREYEIKKAELKSVQQFAEEVTLDPDTAHPALLLSEDGKQVHDGVVRKNLPDNPERSYRCGNPLMPLCTFLCIFLLLSSIFYHF